MGKFKEIIKKNYKWLIFAIAIIIFVAIAEDVFEKDIFKFDGIIYNFCVANRTQKLNMFFKIITNLGNAIVLITLTVVCIIFIKEIKYKILVPVNLLTITGINILLKNLFLRPRPNELRLIEETGYSFPSGHAMISTAFYGLLIYIAYKNIKNKTLRNSVCIGLGLLIFIIDVSRVYVGVHYASDVIAGSCFSIAYLILLIATAKLFERGNTNE